MHIYFDESGDFAFPSDRFDAYVQAALICPTSFVDKIDHYVADAKSRLGVEELHATSRASFREAVLAARVDPLAELGQRRERRL